MLNILDISNHWSPTGGGVRRYQLEKCAAFADTPDVRHILVTPDNERDTESLGRDVIRERVPAPLVPGTGGYRYLLRAPALTSLLRQHRPDVVVCGSPIVMPGIVRRAITEAGIDAATVGFWHADFPRTYAGRAFARLHSRLESAGERLGWWWARRTYGRFDATLVASHTVAATMVRAGLRRIWYSPLGVDAERFHPRHRDPSLVARARAGAPDRRTILFPHRFCDEKGLPVLLEAYERVAAAASDGHRPIPALVFAGTGPHLPRVNSFCDRHEHAHNLGFISDPKVLAAWFASADLTVSLSAWETFGLSTAEAMASGLPVVASDQGAAPELVRDAEAGLCVDGRDPVQVATALETLLRDPDLTDYGRRGRAFVEPLTWAATFQRELAVYRKVVDDRRRGAAFEAPMTHAASLL